MSPLSDLPATGKAELTFQNGHQPEPMEFITARQAIQALVRRKVQGWQIRRPTESELMAQARTHYSLSQRTLHWLTVVLVFFNLLFPGRIERVADTFDAGNLPNSSDLFSANLHVYAGFAILGLTVLRLLVRIIQGTPGAIAGEPEIFHRLGKISHMVFYAVLLIMPALGVAKYFFAVDLAGNLHGGPVKVLLWALIGLHVAAALVHQFFWKTNAIARMVTSSRS